MSFTQIEFRSSETQSLRVSPVATRRSPGIDGLPLTLIPPIGLPSAKNPVIKLLPLSAARGPPTPRGYAFQRRRFPSKKNAALRAAFGTTVVSFNYSLTEQHPHDGFTKHGTFRKKPKVSDAILLGLISKCRKPRNRNQRLNQQRNEN